MITTIRIGRTNCSSGFNARGRRMPLPVFASARYLSKPQPLYTAVRLLLRDVSRRVLSRNAAKDYDIGPVSYTHLTLPTIYSV